MLNVHPFAPIPPQHTLGETGHSLYPSGFEENVRKFTLAPDIKISFHAKDEETTNIGSIAAKEEAALWTNSITAVLWHCRWTQKGLQAIKPAVHLKTSLQLGASRACRLA